MCHSGYNNTERKSNYLNFCLCPILIFFRLDHYDRLIIHPIESMVIKWTHQIRDVLKKDSSEPLLQGMNPGPETELDFWKARKANLLCVYEQVSVIKADILQ